jgi:hypothetical protein
MKRVSIVVALAAVFVIGAQGVAASRPAEGRISHHVGGFVLSYHAATHEVRSASHFRSSNLVYHSGGSVQTGTHHTYAVFWGASFGSGYQSLVDRYFADVAHDSGNATNVYANDTQYYQTIGSTINITYSESFGGSWSDGNPSSSGCSSTAGGTVACVSDAQIQQEVVKAIHANNWPEGLGNEYFVFLGNGISTCSGSSCFNTQFCAYHGDFTDSGTGATVLYANMPYTGYNLSACGSGQYPNNNPAADSTLNVTSHEANETITDPLLNAWYDRSGNEIGDKCAWNFGRATGNDGYGNYNQTIDGHFYYLQGEWSNGGSGCVWT